MKKEYETPEVKKIEFNYEENVVASGPKTNKEVYTSGENTRCIPQCRVCNVKTESSWF